MAYLCKHMHSVAALALCGTQKVGVLTGCRAALVLRIGEWCFFLFQKLNVR